MNDYSGADEHLQSLHGDVVRLLERTSVAFDDAERLAINWSSERGGTPAARRALRLDAESVRKIELRMPVVAQMKAGKSTIVNAIVGYELLPSRALAMTTLPTKIVLDDELDLEHPVLDLGSHTARLFEVLVGELRAVIPTLQEELTGKYPHLRELMDRVVVGSLRPIQLTYEGVEAVHGGLEQLNDLLRLAAYVLPKRDFVADLADVPEVRTGYWMRHERVGTGLGQLVIIDTPGPNEYSIASRLTATVADQIRSSHVLMVVLNYGAMGNQADQDVRAMVEPVVELLGKKSLYLVVNRIDERRRATDLDTQGVRALLAHGFGLTEREATQRIFETAARRGLLGARVLAALERDGNEIDIVRNQATEDLLKEAHPFDWEEEIESVDQDRLERLARRMWERCGLPELLLSAISDLRAQAAPRVLCAALERQDDCLHQLQQVVELERKAASADERVVTRTIAQLDGELAALKSLRDASPGARALSDRFRRRLTDCAEWIADDGRRIIALLVSDEDSATQASSGGWSGHPQPTRRAAARRPHWPTRAIGEVVKTTKGVLGAIVGGTGGGAEDIHEFPTKREAEEFIEKLAGSVIEQLRRLLDCASDGLEDLVGTLVAEVVEEQEKAARAILIRATERLSEEFDVRLEVPGPAVSDGKLTDHFSGPEVTALKREETFERTVKKRAWYKLWLGWRDVQVTDTRSVTSYQVSRRDVAMQLQTAFGHELGRISGELHNYATNDVSAVLTRYYDGLDAYLSRYHATLRQAQDASRSTAEERRQREESLRDLHTQILARRNEVADYRRGLPDCHD